MLLHHPVGQLPEPDWARVCIECDNFDRMNAKHKVTSSNATPIEARQVNQTSGKKGKKGGQRQADPVRQQNYLKLKGRCFNCGDPKHSKKTALCSAAVQQVSEARPSS